MLAVLAAAALAFVVPDPVQVDVGTTAQVSVDAGFRLIYGGSFTAEDSGVARVTGPIRAGSSSGTAEVTGIQPGRTRMILVYHSGISIYRVPITTIVVNPCQPPSVTLSVHHLRLADRQPVTLIALTAGSEPIVVEWRDGDPTLGTANPLTVVLSAGTHRIVAYASNQCGLAASEALEVEVTPPRRRSVRHGPLSRYSPNVSPTAARRCIGTSAPSYATSSRPGPMSMPAPTV